MKGFENQFNKDKYNKMGLENIIQIELAKKIYNCEIDEAMDEWVKKDSETFRKLIENHPGYISEYKESLGDEENKEVVLEKIKERLLKEEDGGAEA
ncbi:MAG TPA: hypothetical protein VKO61_01015 [Candidatus Paceibacterota bacterium]|nr:hypothetical protein [Candidatus Paceibacterota bacterium]